MFGPLIALKRRRRVAISLSAVVALAAGTLAAMPNANAAYVVTPVPGITAGIGAPISCNSIVNLYLNNQTNQSQIFWLRSPLSDRSFSWVTLPPHTYSAVQRTNFVDGKVHNWGVMLNGKQILATMDVPAYDSKCRTGNFLPYLAPSSRVTAQINAHCGNLALITIRNDTAASKVVKIYRDGTPTPIAEVNQAAWITDTMDVPIVSPSGDSFTVSYDTTGPAAETVVLDHAAMSPMQPCQGAQFNWSTTPVAQDQFNGTAVDTSKWWIYNSPTSYPQRTPSQVSESGGELRLTGHVDRTLGYETGGGVGYKTGQKYGHWDVRFRYDAGAGYRSAILLWPDGNQWPTNGEIDFSEIFNAERSVEVEFQHNGPQNKFTGQSFSQDMTRWHTVGVDWMPNRLTYYLDGQEVWTLTKPTDGSFNFVPSTGTMHLALQNDVSCAGICTDANTPENVNLHIDWMKQYAATPAQIQAAGG